MRHFVRINADGHVLNIVSAPDGVEDVAAYFLQFGMDGEWVLLTEDHLRFGHPGFWFTYDRERDAFIPPKHEKGERVLNEDTCL